MLNCFTKTDKNAILITPILVENFEAWLAKQNEITKNWLAVNKFTAKPDAFSLLPDATGKLAQVIIILKNADDFWGFGSLATALPVGVYQIDTVVAPKILQRIAIAWGLGAYQFTRYKKAIKPIAQLFIPATVDSDVVENTVSAIYWVRDLINTPTEHMGPAELAEAAVELGSKFNARVTQIVGEDLLKQNYPAIHAVGRASVQAPRLIDLRWGDSKAPKLTLVGKGVCFDSGGLNIKPASGMVLMKKDMAGAAHALGLARMIMTAKLPVCLRVLIPAVENAIAGNAYRPGDIIATCKGLTVEVGNTDAEGRVVLADALAEAVNEKPDLLIDFSTLTGAARVAVGTEISAMFTDNATLAAELINYGEQEQDPIWRLPLYTPYRKLLDSQFADINNAGNSPYAGAITAALFLKEFVPAGIAWVHFDCMAWNISGRPGRPEGAEAMGLRAVFGYLQQHFS